MCVLRVLGTQIRKKKDVGCKLGKVTENRSMDLLVSHLYPWSLLSGEVLYAKETLSL